MQSWRSDLEVLTIDRVRVDCDQDDAAGRGVAEIVRQRRTGVGVERTEVWLSKMPHQGVIEACSSNGILVELSARIEAGLPRCAGPFGLMEDRDVQSASVDFAAVEKGPRLMGFGVGGSPDGDALNELHRKDRSDRKTVTFSGHW